MNNNYLPILIFAMLASKGKGVSSDALPAVMKMLGLNNPEILKDSPIADLLGGNLSMEKVLPLLIRMMNTATAATPKKAKEEGRATAQPDYLKPIADVAGDEVSLALHRYLDRP